MFSKFQNKTLIKYFIALLALCAVLILFSACTSNKESPDNSIISPEPQPQPQETYYSVTYSAFYGGKIEGNFKQTVKECENAEEVTAVPYTGYYFVKWSDGVTTATRQDINVTSEIDVSAEFTKITFTVRYIVGEGGSLIGEAVQTVNYFGSASATVIAEPHYRFIQWSDGETNNSRTDRWITEDLTLIAEFEKDPPNLLYIAGEGGRIIGNLEQCVSYMEYGEEVIAVPDDGYVFGGWSDASLDLRRRDRLEKQIDITYEFVAYFEPIEKKFKYDYGIASGAPVVSEITITRNELLNLQFEIPELSGYTFCGWYADNNYNLKVVDGDGTYMLGNYGLSLDTDTLYAKWQKNGEEEEGFVHKILLVVVQNVNVSLPVHKSDSGEVMEIDYTMTSIEYGYCSYLQEIMQKHLNDWFKDTDIRFEVDSYYTLLPVGKDSFESRYTISAKYIMEVGKLNGRYHNVIVVQALHDYDHLVSCYDGTAGLAEKKYATVFLDRNLSYLERPYQFHLELEKWKTHSYYSVNPPDVLEESTFHEFVHTCECYYYGKEEMLGGFEFHDIAYGYSPPSPREPDAYLEPSRLYLLGKAEYQGKTGGIPMEYWRHEIDIPISYGQYVSNSNFRGSGRIIVVDGGSRGSDGGLRVSYGSSITIEAIPNEDSLFLMWSDGVTTAIRTDTNIISYMRIEAIFVERPAVNYTTFTYDINPDSIGGQLVVIGEPEIPGLDLIERDVPYGSSMTVEAVPYEGYIFIGWSDGVATARRTDIITSYLKVQAWFLKYPL